MISICNGSRLKATNICQPYLCGLAEWLAGCLAGMEARQATLLATAQHSCSFINRLLITTEHLLSFASIYLLAWPVFADVCRCWSFNFAGHKSGAARRLWNDAVGQSMCPLWHIGEMGIEVVAVVVAADANAQVKMLAIFSLIQVPRHFPCQ